MLLTTRSLQPMLLLCTGTTVAVLGQVVNNQAKISPNAQLLVLARYVFTFASSLAMYATQQQRGRPVTANSNNSSSTEASSSKPARSSSIRTTLLLLIMGALDLASYAIFNLGFAACGSALATVVLAASGQITTALISVLVLRRTLSLKHGAAVAVVTVGLVLRSVDDVDLSSIIGLASSVDSTNANNRQATASSNSSSKVQTQPDVTYGVTCVVASALLFSILGVMYEVLMNADPGTRVSQAQATFVITGVSLLATCAHQLVYSLPNWQQLVLKPVAVSGYSGSSIVASHLVYGLATAVHNYVQVKLLGSHGAMAVGLVNAVRASVVSFVSSWLFCSSVPHLCITYWKAISALVVTCGAVLWVTAGKPVTKHRGALQKRHID